MVASCTSKNSGENKNNGNPDTAMSEMGATGPMRDAAADTARNDSIPGDSAALSEEKIRRQE